LGLFAGICGVAWHVVEGVPGIFDFFGAAKYDRGILAVTDAMVTLVDSAHLLRRAVLEPFAGHLIAVTAIVYMASAFLGAALARLLREREAGQ
jgi:hypothetical protein